MGLFYYDRKTSRRVYRFTHFFLMIFFITNYYSVVPDPLHKLDDLFPDLGLDGLRAQVLLGNTKEGQKK